MLQSTPSSSSGQIINIQSVSGSSHNITNTHQIAMSTETLGEYIQIEYCHILTLFCQLLSLSDS